MPYINIDLDEISTSEIINELEDRYLDDKEKYWLLNIIKQDDDCLKLKLFFKVYKKYSLMELEEMFKEDYSTSIPNNQLCLAI